MDIAKEDLNRVAGKLERQNALKAAIFGGLWSFIILIAWYLCFRIEGHLGTIFLALSGALIGLSIRFHGNGYSSLFSVLALIYHAFLTATAFFYNLILAQGYSVWAILLLMLYAIGAWSAAKLAKINTPFREHKAFYQLSELTPHPSFKKLKNSWIIALPLATMLSIGISFVAMFGFSINDMIKAEQAKIEKTEKTQSMLERSAMDISEDKLKSTPIDEALLHAYAYYKGRLPDKYGNFIKPYPASKYKAQTLLRYYAEEKNVPRAQFILGLISEGRDNVSLINQAFEGGDDYARIYQILNLACAGREDMANEMLKLYARTSKNTKVKKQAEYILQRGYSVACQDHRNTDFVLEHATNFQG